MSQVKSNFKDKERAAAAAAQAAASAFPEEPFFEFTVLKSRTVQIMLFSTALAYAGINAPLFLLVSYEINYSAGRPIIRKVSKIRIWVVPPSAWAVGS